jgi:hypothetical protein
MDREAVIRLIIRTLENLREKVERSDTVIDDIILEALIQALKETIGEKG